MSSKTQTESSLRAATPTISPAGTHALQRQCACGQHSSGGGKCSGCSKEDQSLQRSSQRSEQNSTEVPLIVHEVLRSPGYPLDAETRSFFEPRFNHDFSRVRVHTDTRAAASAEAVNALAYTTGRNVVFAAGQYAPRTSAGQHLLAHELSHVMQQASVTDEMPRRIGPSDDAYEQAAERNGRILSVGENSTLQRAVLQRTCRQHNNESFYAGAANYCHDSPSTGQLHPGQRCYREVPVRSSYFDCPPGDQVCFDAQGGCHDSWDNASPVESKDPDGTCNLHGLCSLSHAYKDDVIQTFLHQHFEREGQRIIDCHQTCATEPWYLRGFCLQGCSGGPPMPM